MKKLKDIKMSLAAVLALLAVIIYGFFCYLSMNFLTLGNTQKSILVSAGIALVLFGLSLIAKFMKATSRNFKTYFLFEIGTLLLLSIFLIHFTYSTFSHFFTVSSDKKQIQAVIIKSIKNAEKMYNRYETESNKRISRYKSKLHSVSKNKEIDLIEYRNYFINNGIDDNTQIQQNIFTMEAKLFPLHFKQMKTEDSIWISRSKDAVQNWNPIDLINIVNNMDENFSSRLDTLISLSKFKGRNETANEFIYDLSFGDAKAPLILSGKPTILSITIAILTYAILLLPWLAQERHPRFPGCKKIFGTKKKAETVL